MQSYEGFEPTHCSPDRVENLIIIHTKYIGTVVIEDWCFICHLLA